MLEEFMSREIDSLRDQIDQIDRTILELIKKRMDVTSEIGRAKLDIGLPLRNFDREKICLENARKIAASLNISPQLAEEIQIKLIQGSLTSQEKDRVRLFSVHNAQKALVIGGAGKMGNWFSHFLASQGFFVRILDPQESTDFEQIDSLKSAVDFDLIVVAAPLQESNRILIDLSRLQPSGLVFDIASLKGPLKEGLTAMASSGLKVTSLHPMFGPDTELLSGRHVIVINLGNDEANMEVSSLFTPTAATIVQMDADEHDRSMAFLLGLSHALNIVFSSVLAASGESAPRLEELSSTTFDAQISVASRVAKENPKLYFEIQALNPFGDLSLGLLEDASKTLRRVVSQNDEKTFNEMMQAGKGYYQSHREKGKAT
jgi:chorismate mutase/prephenate dehydrogenase